MVIDRSQISSSGFTTLGRTAAVVGHGRHVDDLHHLDTGVIDRADSTLAAVTGTLYVDRHLAETGIVSLLGSILGSHLSGVGGVLLRAPEAHLTGRGLADSLTLVVGEGDNDVVERRVDVSLTDGIDLDLPLLGCLILCHKL